MRSSDIPAKLDIPFADAAGAGYIRPIPVASQIPITPGAASLTDGFPPLNFLPEAAGGIPPFGQDMNGILNAVSAWSRWCSAGAPVSYDSAFSTAVGGYPAGALLYAAAGGFWWINAIDNNTSDPDTGGTNWTKFAPGLIYNGNPNGHVAGTDSSAGSFPSMVWDYADNILWLCTTGGVAASAVWTAAGGGGVSTFYGGTSTGTANAQHVTLPSSVQSFAAGSSFWFIVGAGLTNTGACTITLPAQGSFAGGTFAVRKDGIAGPIALAGDEIVAGNTPTVRFDGTYLHLISTSLGTAALANASSNTGTVAAVSGAVTVGHLAVFGDTLGTVQDGGSIPSSALPIIVSTSQTIVPGTYYADTSGGAITLTLSLTLAGVYTFVDAENTWGLNNLTINGNGHNIGNNSTNVAATFLANVSDYQFSIEASSTYWRLV